ncbi:hypothetical protein DRZ77_00110 [Candidatus Woesearchaeota archaeon]|nr:hypothetical protein [Candidatus Woesearchaeota archaeon]RLE41139.1 MAG: hypothetical protein DRZ77_00110 [Candidatus Woesearchaeota archaeon]
MFKWYGLIGILMILLVHLSFFFKFAPVSLFYFPIVWYGYILLIDSIIYKLRRKSLIANHFYSFLGMVFVSQLLWWIFEFINLFGNKNWNYVGLHSQIASPYFHSATVRALYGLISFSTVIPAFFETVELFKTLHLFKNIHLKKHHKISKRLLFLMAIVGIVFLFSVFLFPKICYPFVWLGFFFILDPINYLHHQPSVIRHIKEGNFRSLLLLFFAGICVGFLWEFWNYLSPFIKWKYSVPYVGFLKIFEMPILGYLGYLPFALEMYAFYWFVRSLFYHKEHLLENL